MKQIRILKKIESETLELPELKPFLGEEVEIIVRKKYKIHPGYSKEYLEIMNRGWQGEKLVREDQGVPEEREPLK